MNLREILAVAESADFKRLNKGISRHNDTWQGDIEELVWAIRRHLYFEAAVHAAKLREDSP